MSPKDVHEDFPGAIDLTGVFGVFSDNPSEPAYYYSGDPDAFYGSAPSELADLRSQLESGQITIKEARRRCGLAAQTCDTI